MRTVVTRRAFLWGGTALSLCAAGAVLNLVPTGISQDVTRELERLKREAKRVEELDSQFCQVGETFDLTGRDFNDDRYSASYLSRVGWIGTMRWTVAAAARFDKVDDLDIPELDADGLREYFPKGYFVRLDVDIENIDARAEGATSDIGDGWIRPHMGLVPIEDGKPTWREGCTDPTGCLYHDAVPQGASERQSLYMELPVGAVRRVCLLFAICPNDADKSFSQKEFETRRFGFSIGRVIGESCNGSCVVDLGDLR